MLHPAVYCIVVNWNGWKDTENCVRSLYESEYPNLSVLVVDNGSADQSVERLRHLFPELEVFETRRNLGFAGGNNEGIRLALGRGAHYVWLLNNDTVVTPGTLTALMKTANAHPEAGEIGSVLHHFEPPHAVQAWGGGRVNLWLSTSVHFLAPVQDAVLSYITAASVLIPADVLKTVGLLDDSFFMYWEDVDFSFRVRAAGRHLTVAPDAYVYHKENSSTGRRSAILDRYVTSSGIKFIGKYAPFPPVPVLFLVVGRALKRFLRGRMRNGWAVLTAWRN